MKFCLFLIFILISNSYPSDLNKAHQKHKLVQVKKIQTLDTSCETADDCKIIYDKCSVALAVNKKESKKIPYCTSTRPFGPTDLIGKTNGKPVCNNKHCSLFEIEVNRKE